MTRLVEPRGRARAALGRPRSVSQPARRDGTCEIAVRRMSAYDTTRTLPFAVSAEGAWSAVGLTALSGRACGEVEVDRAARGELGHLLALL